MRQILTLSYVTLALAGFSQNANITGRVIDSKTQQPLPFANVFVNNTTIGTAADGNGYFVLKRVPTGGVELVFSFVGYQTYQTRLSLSGGQTLKMPAVQLVVDEKMLENIMVEGKADKEWEASLVRFNKIFIGSSRIAMQAKIMNPWVLDFRKLGDVLITTASDPIIVENDGLGYKVTYILSKFTSRNDDYSIMGKARFEEMKTFDPKIEQRWTQNRREVYRGSQRHFFRSIIENKVSENGFRVYSDKIGFGNKPRSSVFEKELGNSIEPYDMASSQITFDPKTKLLTIDFQKPRIEVHYLKTTSPIKSYGDVIFPVSWLEMKSGLIKTDSSGTFFGPENTIGSGYMSSLRIGDMLPNDFQPGQAGGLLKENLTSLPPDLGDLLERVHLTTDKPYYYRGDIIWLAGQLHYGNPLRADTLSKVLNVELINDSKEIIQSRSYFIDGGRITGNFYLQDSLAPGDYFLRAYTNWMRNYGEKYFYVKPVRVLTLLESVVGPKGRPVPETLGGSIVKITSDRTQYKTREKVMLEIKVREEEEEPGPALFSISVTDEKQVIVFGNETIEGTRDDFKDAPDPYLLPVYPIEKGISIHGRFQNNKGKGERARINVIRGDRQDFASVDTEDNGRFWVSGFQFDDSTTFALQAKNVKGKVYGKVIIEEQAAPPVGNLPTAMQLEIKKSHRIEHYKINYDEFSGKVLDEVMIKESPLNYAKPDYSLQKERIEREAFGTLFSLVRSSVPGLTVYPSTVGDPIVGASYSYRVGYRGLNQEPLLVIDGVVQQSEEPIATRLNQIPVSNVDHVDFLSYNPRSQFGVQGDGGVIIVYTKGGTARTSYARAETFNSKYFQIVKMKGYDRVLKFRSPDYGNADEDHTQPDFRSTIYWNGNIVTDQHGGAGVTFYTADLTTYYRVVVEGITATGKPFHAEHVIEIK